jgi:hypothetical protein
MKSLMDALNQKSRKAKAIEPKEEIKENEK